jgi:hypothetical protein
MSRLVLAIAAAVVFFASASHARISIYADFDPGSLEPWNGDLVQVNLVGRENYHVSGRWRWASFKASGVLNARPMFSISSNFAGDATPGLPELQPVGQ